MCSNERCHKPVRKLDNPLIVMVGYSGFPVNEGWSYMIILGGSERDNPSKVIIN